MQFLRWYTLESSIGHYLTVKHANEFDAVALAEELLGISSSHIKYTLGWKVKDVHNIAPIDDLGVD